MAKSKRTSIETTELTKSQKQAGSLAGLGIPGLSAAPAGSYETYRKMRECPTIAIARMAATAPIRAAAWSVVADEGVPADRKEFVNREIEHVWEDMLRNALFSLDYGWAPFEVVHRVTKEGLLGIEKIKPLLVDMTEINVDDKTGAFMGLKQENVKVPPEKCLVVTYDGEAGNLYGRPRHENIRVKAWMGWNDTSDKLARFMKKVAGIIPQIQYPPGTGQDATGAEKNNYEIAKQLMASLAKGEGIYFPMEYGPHAEDLLRSGVNPELLLAWKISFIEANTGSAVGFIDALRYWDSAILRGWIVPERAAIEGQMGTKAEAEEHGDLALLIANLTYRDMVSQFNKQLVNPIVLRNWGEDAVGTIRIEGADVGADEKKLYTNLLTQILVNPSNIDLFWAWLDVDALLDASGLPRNPGELPSPTEAKPQLPGMPPEGTLSPAAKLQKAASAMNRLLALDLPASVKSSAQRIYASMEKQWGDRTRPFAAGGFDESEHPRDEQGRWTDKVGIGTTSTVKEVLSKLVEADREGIVILDKNGRVDVSKMGKSRHRVSLSPGQAQLAEGRTVIHNHVGRPSSFSDDDVYAHIEQAHGEDILADAKYVYHLKVPEDQIAAFRSPSGKDMMQKLEQEIESEKEAAERNGVSEEEGWHGAWSAIAARRKWKYSREEKQDYRERFFAGGFDESEHPRHPEGSSEGGQFVPKEGMNIATRSEGRLQVGGKDVPEHIQKLRVPPAWTQVQINPDPKADLLVVGRDAKGRMQAIYSESHVVRQAAAKYERVRSLAKKDQQIVTRIDQDIRSADANRREPAACLSVIRSMGIRPGSDEDTKAAVRAYGATTLEGRHVVKEGGTVRLRYVGKKGVNLDLPVTDPAVAKMLVKRAQQAGTAGKLFATNAAKLRDYTHEVAGSGFKPKDFRTLRATQIAMFEVESAEPPKTMSAYKKAVRAVAKKVAAVLGNTPTVALQSYINPFVFSQWRIAT